MRLGRSFRAVLLAVLIGEVASYPSRLLAGEDGLVSFDDYGQLAVPMTAAAIALALRDVPGLTALAVLSVATMTATHGAKLVIGARRPSGGHGSFPSGHTASAFMGASFLHYRYGVIAAVPFYLTAALVGLDRVESRKHYWIDVLGAAALANIVALLVLRRTQPRLRRRRGLTPD